MEKENDFELTNEELKRFIKTQRKIYCLEEYYSLRRQLLNEVIKIIDLLQQLKLTISNHKKIKKVINKYAKQYKNEKDVKNLFIKLNRQEKMLGCNYIASVMNFMELVYNILNTEYFEKDLTSMEEWYSFEFDDMILVNDVIKNLLNFDTQNLAEQDVLKSLNYAIEKYIDCINNDTNYIDTFDSSFPFVRIDKVEQEEDNE